MRYIIWHRDPQQVVSDGWMKGVWATTEVSPEGFHPIRTGGLFLRNIEAVLYAKWRNSLPYNTNLEYIVLEEHENANQLFPSGVHTNDDTTGTTTVAG